MLPLALNFPFHHLQREYAVYLEEQSPAGLEVSTNLVDEFVLLLQYSKLEVGDYVRHVQWGTSGCETV